MALGCSADDGSVIDFSWYLRHKWYTMRTILVVYTFLYRVLVVCAPQRWKSTSPSLQIDDNLRSGTIGRLLTSSWPTSTHIVSVRLPLPPTKSTMHFLILGASGRTGKLATAAALERGHTVTALVRKASSMQPKDGLMIVQGTPEKQADIEKALAAHSVDVSLVLLNAARASDSPFAKPITPEFFVRDCVRNLTAATSYSGRIVVMSAFGVGSSFAQLPWMIKLVFRHTNMQVQMHDHDLLDEEIRKLDKLDWTLVRPAMLKEGGSQPVKEHGELGKGLGMFIGITRATVAQFMVREAEEGRFKKQAIVIAN